MRKAGWFAGLLLLFSNISPVAPLVAQSTKAELSGMVRDPTGLPVAEAEVKLVNDGTQTELSTTSSAQGQYHFLALQPGIYTITVAKTGFSTMRRMGLTLRVGDQVALDLPVSVGAVTE